MLITTLASFEMRGFTIIITESPTWHLDLYIMNHAMHYFNTHLAPLLCSVNFVPTISRMSPASMSRKGLLEEVNK